MYTESKLLSSFVSGGFRSRTLRSLHRTSYQVVRVVEFKGLNLKRRLFELCRQHFFIGLVHRQSVR